MRWAIKHKSGRTLFVTSDEFIANNRRKMGWIVEEVKMTSREQFESWVKEGTGFDLWRTEYPMTEWDDQQYKRHKTNLAWMAWQASRAGIEIELPDVYGDKYTPSSCTMDGFDFEQYLKDLCAIIESAGLKVKK